MELCPLLIIMMITYAEIAMKKRLFLILWLAGICGTLSLLLVDISALIALLPKPPGDPVDIPHPILLALASVIQQSIVTSVAVLVGVLLADKVGLHSPAAEAWAAGKEPTGPLRRQLLPGIAAGIAGGIAIALSWVIAKPFLSAEFIERAEGFNKLLPNAVRLLYGGITEEILLRWGLMTFLVWALWKLLQKSRAEPSAFIFVISILVSSLLFGILHLPIASILNDGLDLPVTVYIIGANSIFGIVAGFLYWRRGLESAIIAHIFAHVVLITAIALTI